MRPTLTRSDLCMDADSLKLCLAKSGFSHPDWNVIVVLDDYLYADKEGGDSELTEIKGYLGVSMPPNPAVLINALLLLAECECVVGTLRPWFGLSSIYISQSVVPARTKNAFCVLGISSSFASLANVEFSFISGFIINIIFQISS